MLSLEFKRGSIFRPLLGNIGKASTCYRQRIQTKRDGKEEAIITVLDGIELVITTVLDGMEVAIIALLAPRGRGGRGYEG